MSNALTCCKIRIRKHNEQLVGLIDERLKYANLINCDKNIINKVYVIKIPNLCVGKYAGKLPCEAAKS